MNLNLNLHQLVTTTGVLLVGALAGISLLLILLRRIGVLNESFRRHRRRRTDSSKLSRSDRKLIRRAKRLRAQGKTSEAAKILEDNGLLREAVYLADKDGLVLQAAEILLRAGKPHRAGAIYAKHKKWKEAIDCFVQAEMPYEVATCYRKLNDFKNACEYYKAAKRFSDAAWCYEQMEQYQSAARLYRLSDQKSRAMEQFLKLATAQSSESLNFDQSEIDLIIGQIELGENEEKFIRLLQRGRAIGDLLKSLPRFANSNSVMDQLCLIIPTNELVNLINLNRNIAPEIRTAIADRLKLSGTIATSEQPQVIHLHGSPTETNAASPSTTGVDARRPDAGMTDFDVPIQRCVLFQALPREVCREFWTTGRVSAVVAGQLISGEKHEPAQIKILISGEAETRENSAGRGRFVTRKGTGTVIGAKSMLFDHADDTKIVAFHDCQVWSIEVDTIDALLAKNPASAKIFYKALARMFYSDSLTDDNNRKLIA
jgi:tetratricopeptide (TPR) repeat protein